jgi:hypothetical protein
MWHDRQACQQRAPLTRFPFALIGFATGGFHAGPSLAPTRRRSAAPRRLSATFPDMILNVILIIHYVSEAVSSRGRIPIQSIGGSLRLPLLQVGSRAGAVAVGPGSRCCRRLSPCAGASIRAITPFPTPAMSHATCGCRDRNAARATVGGEFPLCTLSVVQRVPHSPMVHGSASPPTSPDGRLARVRFWPRLCTPFVRDSPSWVT